MLAGFPRPPKPKSAACLERCLKGDSKPSGCGRRAERARWDAVRHNHKSTVSIVRLVSSGPPRLVQKFKMIHSHEDLFLITLKP